MNATESSSRLHGFDLALTLNTDLENSVQPPPPICRFSKRLQEATIADSLRTERNVDYREVCLDN